MFKPAEAEERIVKEILEKATYPNIIIMMFDMWLNKSAVWPVLINPEWEEWEKLKTIKAKNKK